MPSTRGPRPARVRRKAELPPAPVAVSASAKIALATPDPAPRDAAPGSANALTPTIVAVGASAGGLEALLRLFEAMPPDSGAAFLVVMHLDPTRESGVARIIGQHTPMPVSEAADGMRIEPDRVYVIAPDASLTIADRALRLTPPPERRGHRFPIDRLFTSLADHQGERAICIVLSGSGSDGTKGLKEIKSRGGCILVQDPATAAFDGMPRSAIAADLADHVLAPEHMPEVLMRLARQQGAAGPPAKDSSPPNAQSIDPVLALLRARSGQNFDHYKPSTLLRRIQRRMGLHNIERPSEYVKLLRTRPPEVAALVKDLMINVTAFFRDPEGWKALEETVLMPLVAQRGSRGPIRVWVPACATGEEAYTLAMLLVSQAEAANKQLEIKVFATDSRDDNLNAARAGFYPEGAVANMPPDYLQRFFDRLDGGYRVKKQLRDLVVFASHNILRDPPFSRIDLISCRNLLIYLDAPAQMRTLQFMHFALRESGYLFLGSAETVGQLDDLFETVVKKWRIFRRLGATRRAIVDFPALPSAGRARPAGGTDHDALEGAPVRLADVARRALLERFAPASVLVDQTGRALWFHGDTGEYLAPPPGEPSRDVMAMAREGLRFKLREAVKRAAADKHPAAFEARIRQGRRSQSVAVTVEPLSVQGQDHLALITFRNVDPPEALRPARATNDVGADDEERRVFESELKTTRAELRETIKRLETTNEELKAANEEVTSMNEEFQSTNEELETSKEELQSFNEELQTVNAQLQHKIQELEEATDTVNNLLASSEIATVFLDSNLCIRWFSPASKALLALGDSDIGRPIKNFANRIADQNLARDAEGVLQKLGQADAEVEVSDGRWYLRRLLPYRTHDNRIAGVVLSLFDIAAQKAAADAVNEARLYAESVVETVRHPIVVLDSGLRVRSVNPAFCEAFSCLAADSIDHLLHELDHGAWDLPELRAKLAAVLRSGEPFADYAIEHEFPRLGRRHMLLNGRRLPASNARPALVLLAIEDVTQQAEAEARRDVLMGELKHRVKNMLATVQSMASLTLRQSSSLDDFHVAFEGRLRALGQATELLVQQNWAGAELGQLVRQTLDPLSTADRIVATGGKIRLTPEAGLVIAMVLHELATNALKYGALSNVSGHIQVTWRLEGPKKSSYVHLLWAETGGPPVTKPKAPGFGTTLIERSVAHQLGGAAKADFRASGVRYDIAFPAARTVAATAPAAKD